MYYIFELFDSENKGAVMENIWKEMFEAAKSVQKGRKISSYIDAGGVAAAVLSSTGKIYTGVCIDTCSTLGELTPEWWIK